MTETSKEVDKTKVYTRSEHKNVNDRENFYNSPDHSKSYSTSTHPKESSLSGGEHHPEGRTEAYLDRPQISSVILLRAYREMKRARLLDEKALTLYKQNKCHFHISCGGHEAVQVAAGLVFRPSHDWFYPYYRDMALVVALGMRNEDFCLSFMNKQDDPNSHGRQMPMHYSHNQLHIVSQSSPTGTQYLQAVGCAVASRKKNLNEVTYVSSGEGACAQGDFHEALNWASRDQLPIVFLIQNNNFAISVHVSEQLAGQSVYKIARGYENLGRFEIDGTNFHDSYYAVREAYHRAQNGIGPSVIEAHVPRIGSHSVSDNQKKYRTDADIERDESRCPIAALESFLIKEWIIDEAGLKTLDTELRAEIEAASEWAEQQLDCTEDEVLHHVYSDPTPWINIKEEPPTGNEITMVDAINYALDEELTRSDITYVFGQDVAGGKGGVFGVTANLTAHHGKERVFNTQLAESSIIGVAIGMATRGLRPIPEIQFGDYIWTAMMQIRNELVMLNYRSAGAYTCPVIIRVPVGGYIRGAHYHSQNIEGTFTHIPGLFVVYPSNATDAGGLLKSAIRGEDPVLFLEHKGLYRQPSARGRQVGPNQLIPLGKARIIRAGSDLTVITWGALVQKSLFAADILHKEGSSIEVIDIRTLVPLDFDTIFASVKKTSRVVIIHEDVQFMGFGAEIAALISDECFCFLDAPIRRLGMKNIPAVGHAEALERSALPQTNEIIELVRSTLNF